MRRATLKHGVYEERYRPTCNTCKKQWPECKHSKEPKRVVFLAGPEEIWCQLNGTNYPAVRYRNFNEFSVVEMVIPETQFRSRFTYVGRYFTDITKREIQLFKARV